MRITAHKILLYGGSFILLAGLLGWAFFSFRPQETLAQAVNPAQIVEQFFPQALIDHAREVGLEPDRDTCFAVVDTMPMGEPKTIIAGYAEGAIRVIQTQGDGSYGVVFEPTGLELGGLECSVDLMDLDGDGVNEVKVAFSGMDGSTGDWFFRWNGVQLINLTPTQGTDSAMTLLSTTDVLDLDHDGVMEIISIRDSPRLADETGTVPNAPKEVYKSLGGVYTLERTLSYYGFFQREAGPPNIFQEALAFPAEPSAGFVLKVINGNRDGSNRVASARIVMNGVEILSPQNFSQQVEFLTIPVALRRNNALEVTLDGKPLGTIIVTVEDTSAQPQ